MPVSLRPSTSVFAFALTALTCTIASLFPSVAPAQSEQGEPHEMVAAPPRVELVADPGSTVRGRVLFINNSPDRYTYTIDALPLLPATHGSGFGVIDTSSAAARSSAADLASWISVSPQISAGKAAPHQKIPTPFTITVPADATPGAHAATLVFSRTLASPGSETDGKTRVVIRASVASQIILTVRGDLQPAIHASHATAPRWVFSGTRPRMHATISNTGNTLQTVTGAIRMSAFSGRAAEDLRFSKIQMLPGGRRVVSARWNDPPLLGWFTPKLHVAGSGASDTLTFPTMFVLPPWWLVAAFVAALSLPVVAYRRMRRSRRSPKSKP